MTVLTSITLLAALASLTAGIVAVRDASRHFDEKHGLASSAKRGRDRVPAIAD